MTEPHQTTPKMAQEIINKADALGVMLASAESCTGGMIAAALTDIAGSSVAVDRGFITYSNAAKTAMLGVPTEVIERHGAVSHEVVLAMAEGAVKQIESDQAIAVSVSGVAGPGGGSVEKPVGLVWFGLSVRMNDQITTQSFIMQFDGNRGQVRDHATAYALELILNALNDYSAVA